MSHVLKLVPALMPEWRSRPSAKQEPEIIVGAWKAAQADDPGVTEDDARDALQQLDPLWDELFPAEQPRIVQRLVERVDIALQGPNLRLRVDGLTGLACAMAIKTERVA